MKDIIELSQILHIFRNLRKSSFKKNIKNLLFNPIPPGGGGDFDARANFD